MSGLAADDGGAPAPLGVAVAGVNVTGTEVSIRCLGVEVVEGVGEVQLPLPLCISDVIAVVEGVITDLLYKGAGCVWSGVG